MILTFFVKFVGRNVENLFMEFSMFILILFIEFVGNPVKKIGYVRDFSI